jgi:hypothetical protein
MEMTLQFNRQFDTLLRKSIKEEKEMEKVFRIAFVLGLIMVFAIPAFADSKGTMDLKVGDEVYACNCGEKCPCNTMSKNPGNCTCGNPMVKAKVTKVEKGKAYLKAEGWEKERVFKTEGKYTCDCGPDCKCNTISQNPGKCTCGAEMKAVKP